MPEPGPRYIAFMRPSSLSDKPPRTNVRLRVRILIVAMGFAVALSAALQKPFWTIPYYHSFSRGESRYVQILFHHNKLPSYIGRVMMDSNYTSGRHFGKAYIFRTLGKVDVMDYGSLDKELRWIP